MPRVTEQELIDKIDSVDDIDLASYEHLATLKIRPPEVDKMLALDPVGDEYRDLAFSLYERLGQRSGYDPYKDEKSNFAAIDDVWRSSSPFSFGSSRFVSEFLFSWAAIFEALDAESGQSVLEYGAGSGQALLMLARMGIDAHGVDIDAESLDLVRRQSEQMGLDVKLERNVFGEGFEGRTFDRVVFFEAFHHAFDFQNLLVRLHDRLSAGGFVVLCGEPIVEENDDSVPYAWGPRMDALSVLCIRRYGWMELGYQREFFIRLLMWCGWNVQYVPGKVFRSGVYVLRPWHERLDMGLPFDLGSGWGVSQGDHRWTTDNTARLPLPWLHRKRFNLRVCVANYLTRSKSVRLAAGDQRTDVRIASGETVEIDLGEFEDARDLTIETKLSSSPSDPRRLGIAVLNVTAGFVE